jgi:D-alanyl-D-alanine carboxypeptidase/D-alanyl-D-alanine-endopeptidase (penicillin-binding protein 4)
MRPRLLIVPLTALLLLAGTPHAGAANTAAGLRSQVDHALLGSTAGHTAVAIDVAGLGSVARRNSTYPMLPASTEKLFTAETAIRVLGASYRQRTELRSAGTKVGSVLRGDLYLVASGDPYFASANLDALAAALVKSGVTSVIGHLRIDDSRYDRVRSAPGWKPGWVPEESGPLSAMALDANQWRHDSGYLADPATPVLAKLRTFLSRRGVRISTSDASRAVVPSAAKVYASHASPPLYTVLTKVLKNSDNFASELLLKEVGKVARGVGSSAAGAQAVHDRTGASGTIRDGSGLSTIDRQSAGHELELLRTSFNDLKTKLPIGCRDGTLKNRFCGTAAAGRVFAKTGTLDNARALAGWTYTRDGHLVTFSILLAGFSSGSSATKAIDRAVVVLAGATVS